jgi:hypothetical protein
MSAPLGPPLGWHLSVSVAGARLSMLLPGTTRELCPRKVSLGLAFAAVAVLADGCRRGYWRRPSRILPAPEGVVTWSKGEGMEVARFGPIVMGLHGGERSAWGELLRLTVQGLYTGALRPAWGDEAGGTYTWSPGAPVGEA